MALAETCPTPAPFSRSRRNASSQALPRRYSPARFRAPPRYGTPERGRVPKGAHSMVSIGLSLRVTTKDIPRIGCRAAVPLAPAGRPAWWAVSRGRSLGRSGRGATPKQEAIQPSARVGLAAYSMAVPWSSGPRPDRTQSPSQPQSPGGGPSVACACGAAPTADLTAGGRAQSLRAGQSRRRADEGFSGTAPPECSGLNVMINVGSRYGAWWGHRNARAQPRVLGCGVAIARIRMRPSLVTRTFTHSL